jgi:hypothetical protein
LSRYYTQGLEVRAPGSGEILRVIDSVSDNAPGGCNFAHNWGNHLILRLDYGGIMKLAHFTKNGIVVKAGQRVAAGDLLGYCGNTGRSPVPHIHLHAQTTTETGAPTTPFCLTNFFTRTETTVCAGTLPACPKLEPASPPRRSPPPCWARWRILRRALRLSQNSSDPRITPFRRFHTTLDDSGRYLFSEGKDSLTAVLGLHALQITQSSLGAHSQLLRLLSFAMPTVPFAYQSGMNWEDCVALSCKAARLGMGGRAPYLGHRTQRVITPCAASHHSAAFTSHHAAGRSRRSPARDRVHA